VWSADGAGVPLLLRGHEGGIVDAAFSPDGKRIVTASSDATARVWNADGAGVPLILRGHEKMVVDAAFSPDGKRIATASEDKTARVWSDLVPLRGPDDPKLWTATQYCLSIQRRTEPTARADHQACERRVEQARAASAGRP